MKLNIGCGQRKREGFVGVDMVKTDAVDVVHDLRVRPWPFDDESVDEVYCAHFLEHLTGQERMPFMDELYRVMRRGAQATFVTPYWTSVRAIQDPTHQWPPIAERSYLYFNKEWRANNGLAHYPLECDFDFTYGYALDGTWAARHHEAQSYAVMHYNNVAADITVVLTKR